VYALHDSSPLSLSRYNAIAEHADKDGEGAEGDGGGVGEVTRYETGVDEMNFFYTRLCVLSAMLLPVLAGCQSYARPLGGTNPTIPDAKHGQDCRVHVFGIGGGPDVSGIQAMRSAGITKLRSAEYRANAFAGVGRECVIADGE
jgi:hypothetical protein